MKVRCWRADFISKPHYIKTFSSIQIVHQIFNKIVEELTLARHIEDDILNFTIGAVAIQIRQLVQVGKNCFSNSLYIALPR